jgi:hypothetical protein
MARNDVTADAKTAFATLTMANQGFLGLAPSHAWEYLQ